MQKRDILKIKAIKSNDPLDWNKFKRMRNLINTQIKSSKKSYYTNKFNETYGDPHKTWQVINELTSRKSYKPSIREIQLNGVSMVFQLLNQLTCPKLSTFHIFLIYWDQTCGRHSIY